MLMGDQSDLHARTEPQFPSDTGEMGAHGPLRNSQITGEGAIRVARRARRKKEQHFRLASGQKAEIGSAVSELYVAGLRLFSYRHSVFPVGPREFVRHEHSPPLIVDGGAADHNPPAGEADPGRASPIRGRNAILPYGESLRLVLTGTEIRPPRRRETR